MQVRLSFWMRCGGCARQTPAACTGRTKPVRYPAELWMSAGRKFPNSGGGMVVQTVGDLDDPFDYEGMMETEAQHKKHFFTLIEKLKSDYPDMLSWKRLLHRVQDLRTRTLPAVSRKKRISSLEAYGRGK